ncbi:hypothetical protein P170DRAFT_433339 [Aspergillus steynii IBT 23096]|uniref:Uncharacterized protein n=1 Tax=Aspergillus steynii IBT 23096 TaxID=1392250 RepID=A0A2I2GSK4_9EURO|nr:uncharacterized protein P170DRAFT_433339 [Aspergillus steynii IBT 23096]PLB55864.1 hypothetical protein P170DRAFT_433339 [Aspergillus steynii IBT 23096]
MNALKRKVRSLIDSAMTTASGPKRLLNFDPSTPGRRVWPADNPRKNAEWEIRLDAGEPKQDNPDLVAVNLQINREAKNSGLKRLLKTNGSHHTYATAWVNVKEDPTQQAADKLADDLVDDIEGNN